MKLSFIKQISKVAYLNTSLIFLLLMAISQTNIAAEFLTGGGAATTESATTNFKIGSNGSAYIIKEFGSLKAEVRITIHEELNILSLPRKIKSYETWLLINAAVSYKENSVKKNYPAFNRPSSVNRVENIELFPLTITQYAKDLCNTMASHLRQDGLSNQEIFSINRTVPIAVHAKMQYRLTTGSIQEQFPRGEPLFITANCEKWAGASVTPTAKNLSPSDPVVLDSWLILSKITSANGTCRLNFNGSFKTSAPDVEVSFRFHDDKGNISDLKTETTGSNSFAFFSHDYDVPNNPDGAETGAIRIVGVSHQFESSPVDYEMNCSAGPATQFDIVNPPKLNVVLASLEDYIEMPDKRLCPSKARFMGTVDGNGHPFNGHASLQVREEDQPSHFSDIFPANAPANSWVLFGGYVEELDWSQSNTEGTLAPGTPIGNISKTLYAKVKVYDDEKNPIQPVMAFKTFEAKCKTGPQIAVATQSAQLKNLIPAKKALPLKTGVSKKQPKTIGQTAKMPNVIKANLGQADLMATNLGMSLAGSINTWGSTVVLNNPASATTKGIGRSKNLCRFKQTAFRPFNKGSLASGNFKATVYRNNKQVKSASFNLKAKSGLPGTGWYKFDLDLAEGMNTIKVEMDSGKSVAESNENNNTYTLNVNVAFPCSTKSPMAKTIAPRTKRHVPQVKSIKMQPAAEEKGMTTIRRR